MCITVVYVFVCVCLAVVYVFMCVICVSVYASMYDMCSCLSIMYACVSLPYVHVHIWRPVLVGNRVNITGLLA